MTGLRQSSDNSDSAGWKWLLQAPQNSGQTVSRLFFTAGDFRCRFLPELDFSTYYPPQISRFRSCHFSLADFD